MDMAPDANWNDFKNAFPYIKEVKAEGQVLKLEFRETLNNFNPIIQYLIQKDIKIKEIKAGLEALYMKIVLTEEGRVA
jgi:hypothetical protein